MFKMKLKFIYLAFFTCLLFLFANERDTNKETTENYHNNDFKVHFVVHKTKKPKKENFLERKIKRTQKKVKRLVEKYDESKKDKKKVIEVIGIILLTKLIDSLFGSIGSMSVIFVYILIRTSKAKKHGKVKSKNTGKQTLIILSILLLLISVGFFMSIAAVETLRFFFAASIGATYTAPASAGSGVASGLLLFLFISLIIFLITKLFLKKEQQQKDS